LLQLHLQLCYLLLQQGHIIRLLLLLPLLWQFLQLAKQEACTSFSMLSGCMSNHFQMHHTFSPALEHA
jgi:hypothetical protein